MKIIKRAAMLFTMIALLLLAGRWYLLQPPVDSSLDNGARLQWVSCWFDIPLTSIAHCAFLSPSLQNETNPVSLPVVVFRDFSLQHKPDPVLYINGGPGASSGIDNDYVDYWFNSIEEFDWKRDFVVFDHRGTGLSKPKPQCKELFDFYLESLTSNMTLEEESMEYYRLTKECHARLIEKNQPVNFSTYHNAQDVRDLINVMSDTEWNIYAVSYGTRVALELIREYTGKIRSVILDSVYPSDKHPLLESPALLNNAIEMIFVQCEGNTECHEAHPALRDLYSQALDKLQTSPVPIRAYAYEIGDFIDVLVNDHHFLYALYMAMYDIELAADIPEAISGAARGDGDAMQMLVESYVNWVLDTELNDVNYYSVECNDRELVTEKEYQEKIEPYPDLLNYTRYGWRYDPCRIWGRKQSQNLSKDPVSSTIPTLILSGRYDPVTPWQWGAEVNSAMPNSYHFVYDKTGHSVLDSSDCALDTSREFIHQPDKAPNIDC